MVSQAWETSKDEAQLSSQEIEGIIKLWSNYLTNVKKDIPHKKFQVILRTLLELIDESGVVYGTLKELSESTGITPYILAKNFDYLTKHGLLYRRNGILVVNTNAFTREQLKKGTEDYYR